MKNIEIYYAWQVHDASGLLVAESGLRPAHSFTVGFAKLLFNLGLWLSAENPTALTTTGGASVTTVFNASATLQQDFVTNATTSVSTYGIQVGTGTTAEAITDTALATQIATGTSVGQLQYGGMTYGAPTTTATTTTFRSTRVFTNGSGGTVTVEEIGLVSRSDSETSNRFLLIRDLTGSVTVNNGQQLTVNYDLTTTI